MIYIHRPFLRELFTIVKLPTRSLFELRMIGSVSKACALVVVRSEQPRNWCNRLIYATCVIDLFNFRIRGPESTRPIG